MKYLYFDSFLGFTPCMSAGSLINMSGDTENINALLSGFDFSPRLIACEVKRNGIDGLFAHIDLDCETKVCEYGEPVNYINEARCEEKLKNRLLSWYKRKTDAYKKAFGENVKTELDFKSEIREICEAAICFDIISGLNVDAVYISSLMQGKGVSENNGEIVSMPLPVTEYMCRMCKLDLKYCDILSELITLGGAVMLAELECKSSPRPAGTLLKTGYGAGDEIKGTANILRCAVYEDGSETTEFNAQEEIGELFEEISFV